MVARLLWEQDAAGSSPVTSTKKALELLDSRAFFFVYCGSNIILLYQRIQQLLLRCY